MTNYGMFKEYLKERYEGPYMATDLIIRYTNGENKGIIIIERKLPPLGLALPGGIAERMPFYKNARKEGKEETGLEVELDNPDTPFCVLSELNQDPRGFIATAVYTGVGRGLLRPHPNEDAKTARIVPEEELEKLLEEGIWAFPHHKKILRLYLGRRKEILGGKNGR